LSAQSGGPVSSVGGCDATAASWPACCSPSSRRRQLVPAQHIGRGHRRLLHRRPVGEAARGGRPVQRSHFLLREDLTLQLGRARGRRERRSACEAVRQTYRSSPPEHVQRASRRRRTSMVSGWTPRPCTASQGFSIGPRIRPVRTSSTMARRRSGRFSCRARKFIVDVRRKTTIFARARRRRHVARSPDAHWPRLTPSALSISARRSGESGGGGLASVRVRRRRPRRSTSAIERSSSARVVAPGWSRQSVQFGRHSHLEPLAHGVEALGEVPAARPRACRTRYQVPPAAGGGGGALWRRQQPAQKPVHALVDEPRARRGRSSARAPRHPGHR